MQKKKLDIFSKVKELPAKLYFLLAVFMMVIHITICANTYFNPATVGFILLLIYAAISAVIFLIFRQKTKLLKIEADDAERHASGVIYSLENDFLVPYVMITGDGRIISSNTAFDNMTDTDKTTHNMNISQFCGEQTDKLLKKALSSADIYEGLHTDFDAKDADSYSKDTIVDIGERNYRVECHPVYIRSRCFYMILFHDVTEYLALDKKYYNEHTAVAYIVLDNMDSIAQYARDNYQEEENRVGNILKTWAREMGGVIRSPERNKYIMICNRESLNVCITNRFPILDSVRNVLIGEDRIPITISVGVATTGQTLAEREKDASIALDLALQRGGDQAVLKNHTGTFYFGGRTKSLQKRSGGKFRTAASKLAYLIAEAPNVLIMGHSNPDFDSIGACVGVAAFARHIGNPNIKIVTDLESGNFKACTARLKKLPEYKYTFIDGVTAQNEIDIDTLVIIVDVNNLNIVEAPDIVKNVSKYVILDHHIQKEEYDSELLYQYIDPSASSTCELLAEILEHNLPVGTLKTEEANILLAGIMVDTKNFTRTVGSRTFASALYLRTAGASPEYVRTFFAEAFEDYRFEAKFGTNAKIHRDSIAITAIEGIGSSGDRVAAAKAADKLLTVKNVKAAFALVRVGSTVFISARSNGSINVQLILEKIGGGGHFDVAGAAIAESQIDEAEYILKNAIDEYLDSTEENN